MKKLITILVASAAIFTVFTAEVTNSSGRAGVTGSPGEATCNQTNCHNSFTLNSGTGSINATSTLPAWTYTPGTDYTINLIVKKTGLIRFGIGAEILLASGANAGTMTITNSTQTQFKSATIGSNVRKNLVHQLNGGVGTDSCVFSFSWTAPSTDVGKVTLYAAGNCSNSSGTASGDYIYTMVRVFDSPTTAVPELLSATNPVTVFPNPASEKLNIQCNIKSAGNVTISLFDIKGSRIVQLFSEERNAGEFNEQFDIPSACTPGIYTLLVSTKNGTTSKRVVIR